jgi:hypothetical protein
MPPTRSPQKGLTAFRRTLRHKGDEMSIVAMVGCLFAGVIIGVLLVPVALGAAMYEKDFD